VGDMLVPLLIGVVLPIGIMGGVLWRDRSYERPPSRTPSHPRDRRVR
jgi:hypothetical protein